MSLPIAAVKESRDRVSTALTNSGFKFPVDPVRQEAPEANFAKSSAQEHLTTSESY
jgi:predicted ATPase with chaperone activity